MLPNVAITKTDGQTGVVRPGADGILAIIAPCEKGTLNVAAAHTRPDLVLSAYGYGALSELAAYVMSVAKRPVVLVRCASSTAGTTGTVTHSGAGTSVVTASGTPLDDFDVVVKIIAGGTIGTAGITYTYSLDGGETASAVQSLGTANNFSIPNTGITVNFAAGTTLAGQTESFSATGPQAVSADLTAALEALRVSSQRYEAVLFGACIATSAIVTTVDSWLSAREAEGKYRAAILNARMRNAGETSAAYTTAMQTAYGASSSIRLAIGADGGDLASIYRAINMIRPTSLALAARAMASDLGRDAAFVADGPVSGYVITDGLGNPTYHDESLFPGVDDLRLVSLRSLPGKQGAYVTNPNLLSPSGSDYVYLQHARVMNRACEIAFDILTNRLSQGVQTKPQLGPNGEVYILEADALEIEGLVNAEFAGQLVKPGRVANAKFVLSRLDNLGSNGPATLSGEVQIAALRYVKTFNINSHFVRSIAATAA